MHESLHAQQTVENCGLKIFSDSVTVWAAALAFHCPISLPHFIASFRCPISLPPLHCPKSRSPSYNFRVNCFMEFNLFAWHCSHKTKIIVTTNTPFNQRLGPEPALKLPSIILHWTSRDGTLLLNKLLSTPWTFSFIFFLIELISVQSSFIPRQTSY